MTASTEIETLEKDFKAINECGPAWPALDGILKAMKVYLSLLKGEHETLCIVPREASEEINKRLAEAFHPEMEGKSVAYLWPKFIRASQESQDE